jgi:Trk K+ transport system NAD-binding subunit
MGYRKRTSFLAGLTVAQISEFSLILAALGVSLGHIDAIAMGLITFVGLITIGLSTYLIIYSGPIYEWLAPALGVFERAQAARETEEDARAAVPADIILFGLGRYGGNIASHLLARNRRVLGVDFDPQALASWRGSGLPVVYGDAEDPELFEHLPLEGSRWVVSTAPGLEVNRVLLRHLRQRGYAGRIAVACRGPEEEGALRAEGATTVLRPFADAAEQAADILTGAMNHLDAFVHETPGLRETRLSPGSIVAGQTIEQARFGSRFGVTVLAVSRSGRSFMSPGPDFQLFPGDRLILSGSEAALSRAVEHLLQLEEAGHSVQDFGVAEIPVNRVDGWTGRRLVDLDLRQTYGWNQDSRGRESSPKFAGPGGSSWGRLDALHRPGALRAGALWPMSSDPRCWCWQARPRSRRRVRRSRPTHGRWTIPSWPRSAAFRRATSRPRRPACAATPRWPPSSPTRAWRAR